MHQRGYIKDEKYIKEKVHYYTTVSAVQKLLGMNTEKFCKSKLEFCAT